MFSKIKTLKMVSQVFLQGILLCLGLFVYISLKWFLDQKTIWDRYCDNYFLRSFAGTSDFFKSENFYSFLTLLIRTF